MEFKSEEWQHINCRSKKPGHPVYVVRKEDGWDKWECSKCGLGFGSGYRSYETALETFWIYVANQSYKFIPVEVDFAEELRETSLVPTGVPETRTGSPFSRVQV